MTLPDWKVGLGPMRTARKPREERHVYRNPTPCARFNLRRSGMGCGLHP
jgi:hypothetical protein